MRHPTSKSLPEVLDGDGRVAADRNCVRCGYNLRTLPSNGVCPECATAVSYSLRDWLLEFAPAKWTRKLARGLLMLLIAAAAMVLFMLIMVFVWVIWVFPATRPGGTPTGNAYFPVLISHLPNLVIMALSFWGLWVFTAPEPRGEPPTTEPTARRLLRVLIWIIPFGLAVSIVWLFIPFGISWSPLGSAISAVLGLVAALLGGLIPVLVMRYLCLLMRRIPRPRLARFAQIEFWGLLVCLVLLAISQTIVVGSVAQMAPAIAGVNPNTTPWQSGGFPIGGLPTAPTTPGGATAGTPSTLPTATAPATSLPAGFPGFGGPSLFLVSVVQACGGCAGLGFGIAGFVLVILAQRALAAVATRAATAAVTPAST